MADGSESAKHDQEIEHILFVFRCHQTREIPSRNSRFATASLKDDMPSCVRIGPLSSFVLIIDGHLEGKKSDEQACYDR